MRRRGFGGSFAVADSGSALDHEFFSSFHEDLSRLARAKATLYNDHAFLGV